jgi:hypothetical protein
MSAEAFARLYRSRTPLDADTAREISANLAATDKANSDLSHAPETGGVDAAF